MNADKMQGDGNSEAQSDVLLVAMEMGLKNWRLALAAFGSVRHREKSVEAGQYGQGDAAVAEARERFGLAQDCRVVVCYEAGRDGFYPYRRLDSAGYTVWLIDSSSIEVDRRQRRAKNDALDAARLLGLMQRRLRGEKPMRLVRVPSPAQEDERQRSREREELRQERQRLKVRMQSLLFAQGLRECPRSVANIERWVAQRQELPRYLEQRVRRELERLSLVSQQLKAVERELRHAQQHHAAPTDVTAARLCQLRGIGERGAWVLSAEMFGWRRFRNRREVGAIAGLVPTPYDSGESIASKVSAKQVTSGCAERSSRSLGSGWTTSRKVRSVYGLRSALARRASAAGASALSLWRAGCSSSSGTTSSMEWCRAVPY